MTVAVLFPGQGSQTVGMGSELFARYPEILGSTADQVLGWSLRDMCLNGPTELLTRTENAQPALFAVAFARWLDVKPIIGDRVAAAAGHSLGEFTALAAAGVLGFDQALALVAERGAAMAAAADAEPSGMAALIGATPAVAESIAAQRSAAGGRLTVANLNAPGQVVVAGGVDDLDWLSENAKELGVRRAIRLNVAGAFHSPFMESAKDRLLAVLETASVEHGAFPVYANVTGRPIDVGQVTELLGRQMMSPVRFQDTLENMATAGIDTFVHVGPGDVTAGMAKRTVTEATVAVVSDDAGVAELSTIVAR